MKPHCIPGCWPVKELVTQVCLALCDHIDCSPPVSSVHGILQVRILEWVATPFSRRPSWPRDWTSVSHNAGRFFTISARTSSKSSILELGLLNQMLLISSKYFFIQENRTISLWKKKKESGEKEEREDGRERQNLSLGSSYSRGWDNGLWGRRLIESVGSGGRIEGRRSKTSSSSLPARLPFPVD